MKTETENLRELDAFCAERVMGLERHEWQPHKDQILWRIKGKAFAFRPTTDPAAAMQVLEKCVESGVLNGEFKVPVVIRRRGDKQFVISESAEDEDEGSDRRYIVVEAETLPLALCRFAKALYSK